MMKNLAYQIFSQTFETPLELFSLIIESDFSPWRKQDVQPEQYTRFLKELPEITLTCPVALVPDFPAPIIPKQQYYLRLIQNAFNGYLNWLLGILGEAIPEAEKTFRLHSAIQGEIAQKLRDVQETFTHRNIISVATPEDFRTLRVPEPEKVSAYILNALKFHLIALAANVQNLFPEYFQGEILPPSDIHEQYFFAPLSERLFKAPQMDKRLLKKGPVKPLQKSVFKPIMDDLADRDPAPVSFQGMIAKKYLLEKVENHLYDLGYLTEGYTMTEKQTKGVKPEIAQCILELKDRGAFKSTADIIKGGKQKLIRIDYSHILAFFNARYKTNLTDQFNGLRRKDEKYAAFLHTRAPNIKRIFAG